MNRGFSLIELVVTITIMVILAAFALPLFNQRDVDVTWFFDQVKAAVRYAQRQAVAQRRPVFVVVSATNIELCYANAAAGACPPASRVPALAQVSSSPDWYRLPAPNGISLSPVTFSFNGLGQPNPMGGATIDLLVDAAAVRSVTVTRETGYVP